MALGRMKLTALACRNCRNILLKSLFPETTHLTNRHAFPHARQLETTSIVSSGGSKGVVEATKAVTTINNSEKTAPTEDARISEGQKVEPQDTSLPWYLREPAGPFRGRNLPDALADRQRLPDLPPYAPPILQPLLEHVSVDIGLDDLRLLDLRRIDPPPALGANLVMIIGTARSAKHLHVSADRLCRWLRTIYKLRPEADGLLGRNELKLKLKRRARRMKMLASVNAVDRPNRDDGISTDWVCVNIGQVEPAADAPDFIQRRPGFVGFGTQTKKVTLVVQMLTEEKRTEMDLEGLWKTVQKIKDMNRPNVESEPSDPENSSSASAASASTSAASVSAVSIPAVSISAASIPAASIPAASTPAASTSAASTSAASASERRVTHSAKPKSSVSGKSASFLDRPITMQNVQTRSFHNYPRSNQLVNAAELPKTLKYENPGNNFSNKSKISTQELVEQLLCMKHEDALLSLGKDAEDWSGTTFSYELYKSIPAFPEMIHWESLADLYLHALKLRHPGYTVEDVNSLLSKAELSGVDISERFFIKVFEATLLPVADHIANGQPVRGSLAKASKVMEKMENYGHDPLSDRLILSLNKSITPASILSDDNTRRELPMSLHDQLHDVMDAAGVTPMEERFYRQLLASCAQLGHWRGFWNVWHGVARRSLARSAELYKFAFAAVADTGHQSRCLAALRYCVPQMRKENPPVRIEDDLARAIKSCVLVAEPDIENQAASDTFIEGEFVPLWNRCESLSAEK